MDASGTRARQAPDHNRVIGTRAVRRWGRRRGEPLPAGQLRAGDRLREAAMAMKASASGTKDNHRTVVQP